MTMKDEEIEMILRDIARLVRILKARQKHSYPE